MVTSTTRNVSRKWSVIALILSSVVLIGGLVLSLVIDDWIALIWASGLVIFPLGAHRLRKKYGPSPTLTP